MSKTRRENQWARRRRKSTVGKVVPADPILTKGVRSVPTVSEKAVHVKVSSTGDLLIMGDGISSGVELPNQCIVLQSPNGKVTFHDRDQAVLVVFSSSSAVNRYMADNPIPFSRSGYIQKEFSSWDTMIRHFILSGYEHVHIDPSKRHLPREVPFATSAELQTLVDVV